LEKQLRWIIALNLIGEKVKAETPEVPEIPKFPKIGQRKGRAFVRRGNKIVMLSDR
jgi:hypothetical protein